MFLAGLESNLNWNRYSALLSLGNIGRSWIQEVSFCMNFIFAFLLHSIYLINLCTRHCRWKHNFAVQWHLNFIEKRIAFRNKNYSKGSYSLAGEWIVVWRPVVKRNSLLHLQFSWNPFINVIFCLLWRHFFNWIRMAIEDNSTTADGVDKVAVRQPPQSKFRNFLNFVYDKKNGTVLGRTGRSWCKFLKRYSWTFQKWWVWFFFSVEITVFYIIFYSCLAGFFAINMAIFLHTLRDDQPRYFGKGTIIGINPGKRLVLHFPLMH